MTNENQPVSKDDLAAVERCKTAFERIRKELAEVIVGQSEVIEQVLVAIFARGHALLEGVPGLAKTLLISSLAEATHLTHYDASYLWLARRLNVPLITLDKALLALTPPPASP